MKEPTRESRDDIEWDLYDQGPEQTQEEKDEAEYKKADDFCDYVE